LLALINLSILFKIDQTGLFEFQDHEKIHIYQLFLRILCFPQIQKWPDTMVFIPKRTGIPNPP